MKKIFLSFFISLVISLEGVQEPITIVHTQDRILLREEITSSLIGATQSILILTFTLSDPEILMLLNQKANDGVDVTVIIDKEHQLPILSLNNNNIHVFTRLSGEGRVHHKILVVDQDTVWIGSANFTDSAFSYQENLMVKIGSSDLADFFHQEATFFHGNGKRDPNALSTFHVGDQTVRLGLLPHDGFPAQQIEKLINASSKKMLIEMIQKAKSKIQIAMMAWTDLELANAIKAAHNKGIDVEVVAADLEGVIIDLIHAGIPVRVNKNLSFLHNKMMYVDQSILVNGSDKYGLNPLSREMMKVLLC